MNRRARIIDFYSRGSYHEVINQSYLMMVSELYDSVEYIADETSCWNIKQLLKECNVPFENVTFVEKKFKKNKRELKGIHYLFKLINVSLLNYYYYLKTPKNTDVFYNNNLFFATLLIQYFSWYKKNAIYDMCHNEMEVIDSQKAIGKIGRYILARYFRFIYIQIKLSKRFHFILLSDSMVDYFKSFISSKNHNRIFSIDHAYIRPTQPINNVELPTDIMKIGIPGAITPARGFSTLETLLSNISHSNVKIYAISTISEQIESSHLVILNKKSKLMPFSIYNAYIKSMDVLLFLYDTDSYKLTASGAILEAIWNGKPIIALRNEYFSYLFKKYGKMGILCENMNELVQTINNCMDIDFTQFSKTIQKTKWELMPCYVSEQLKEIIKSNK